MQNRKSRLPPGPWHNEPDFEEFTEAGLTCQVRRMHAGHLCGYVAVPPDHWTHGLSIYVPEPYIQVHGGLSFAGECDDDSRWWFGFDCAHAGDKTPASLTAYKSGIYRDFQWVKAETAMLARQFATLAPPVIPPLREIAQRVVNEQYTDSNAIWLLKRALDQEPSA